MTESIKPGMSVDDLIAKAVPVSEKMKEGLRLLEGRDRLTVKLMAYHESEGIDPISVDFGWSDFTQVEQTYVRRLRASEALVKLDYGWVQSPGMILVRCHEASANVPSPQEPVEPAHLLVSFGVERTSPSFVVRQKRFILFEPESHNEIYVASSLGSLNYSLWVFSK